MPSDVCLILEGSYPYVSGGVAKWVADLLERMPRLRFSILCIGAAPDLPRARAYTPPPNVVEIRDVFVRDFPRVDVNYRARNPFSAQEWETLARFQADLALGRCADVMSAANCVRRVRDDRAFTWLFSRSEESWDALTRQYSELAPPEFPLLHFFWTHRVINLPVLNLLRTEMPPARLYHAASTGYAGLLGALAHGQTGAPFIVTEHGLYARERRLEIFGADWVQDPTGDFFLDMERAHSFLKEWWIRAFMALSRIAYEAADRILTLFEDHRQAQLADGAPVERTEIIANGIDAGRYLSVPPRMSPPGAPARIGFVGRIAPIKDVKTLLSALAILKSRGLAFEALIIGPLDQEPEYAEACQAMAARLGLAERVRFLGHQDPLEYYGQLDIVVLTSVSEGQPFVILEANGAGVPVVATDVGGCREMLEGRAAEDKALGPSGLLTPVATPPATATAIERLALSPALRLRMGNAGRRRVQQHYDVRDVMDRYAGLYESLLSRNGGG